MTVSMQTQQPCGWFRSPSWAMPSLAEACRAGLSLPLSVRTGQWRWGRGLLGGRGRGRCRGLRGRGLRERRHIKTSEDSETKSSPERQPVGAPPDGRTPLQGGGRGGQQPDSKGESGAFTHTHLLFTHHLLNLLPLIFYFPALYLLVDMLPNTTYHNRLNRSHNCLPHSHHQLGSCVLHPTYLSDKGGDS